LVVDDELGVLDSIQQLLRREFQILRAGGGAQALDLLQQNEVSLILVDQRMPGMTGDCFLQKARELKPEVIRVLLTGYCDLQLLIRAVNEGQIFRYLSKPWDDNELLGVVRQGVEHYELVQERSKLTSELQATNGQLQTANTRLRDLTDQLLLANAALLKSLSNDKQQIGQYRLLEKVDKQGSMGTVYKAVHVLLMKVVALKVLPADRFANEAAVARFRREIKAVGRLEHPNIVQARDAGEVDGTHYLVMEFIDGIDLSSLLLHHGPVTVPDACELIRQAAVGLQHAFRQGLVHRDLKPSNLMLARGGIVKILDLGLARLCDESSSQSPLTGPEQIMGTADYMAPEQAFGPHLVDVRADLYSLGCTLYHLIAGRAPFSGPEYPSTMKKLLAHAQTPAVSIRELRGEVNQDLAALIERLMAKQPSDRFEEPSALITALEAFVDGSNTSKLMDESEVSVRRDGVPPATTDSGVASADDTHVASNPQRPE
jgi:serine/threonine protein kinase/ActR/RegA family two-component response regulator